MNTKRQTIWLVSMLSLMVVLSAYYLFTEDVNKLNTATEKTAQQQDIKVTTEVKDPKAGDQAVSGGVASSTSTGDAKAAQTQTQTQTQTQAQAQAQNQSKTTTQTQAQTQATGKAADGKAATDAQVLDKVASAAKSGSDYFAEQAYKRNQAFSKQVENLMNIMADTKKSADEITKATDEYENIQTMQAKVENLEDLLGKSYKNVIVLEENKKYKAVVQADKLDAKQAQGIIDMMIKELNVAKDAVSVQYVH